MIVSGTGSQHRYQWHLLPKTLLHYATVRLFRAPSKTMFISQIVPVQNSLRAGAVAGLPTQS